MILNMDKIQFENRAEIGAIIMFQRRKPRPFARTSEG